MFRYFNFSYVMRKEEEKEREKEIFLDTFA